MRADRGGVEGEAPIRTPSGDEPGADARNSRRRENEKPEKLLHRKSVNIQNQLVAATAALILQAEHCRPSLLLSRLGPCQTSQVKPAENYPEIVLTTGGRCRVPCTAFTLAPKADVGSSLNTKILDYGE